MVTTKPSSNGTAQKTVTTSTATTAQVEQPTQKEIKVETQTPTAPILPTVEVQREKNKRLNLLFAREEKLKDTRTNLETFRLASDESTNSLTLTDGKSAKFQTSSPVLIAQIIDLIKKTADLKLSEVGAEIIALG